MYLKRFRLVVLLALLVSACQSEDATQSLTLNVLYESPNSQAFQKATEAIKLEFPRDHGEHLAFQTEWWYFVGILRDEAERSFGFQFTMFRQGLAPEYEAENSWRTGQIYMAHMAISDIQLEKHTAFERFSRGHPELATVKATPFTLQIEDWRLQSIGEDFSPMVLQAESGKFQLALELTLTKPPFPHGDRGLSWKSPTNASYYYSIPRIVTTGTIGTPEGLFKVSGSAWMDHEWSSGVLNENYRGWNWLTLHLDQNQDLVLFNLIPKSDQTPIMPVGVAVDAVGNPQPLQPDRWQLNPIRFWKDWPVEWELIVDDRNMTVEAAYDDQLMTTTIRYWEGAVFVTDEGERVGEGYLELTGY